MPGQITCHCMTCPKCRARERSRERHRLRAYGRWQPWADPEPARRHVRALMHEGMSIVRIANASSVHTSRISRLLYGRYGAPLTKIQRDFSDTILAVESESRLVPAWRVRRRLGALVALGYSQNRLAALLDCSQNRVWELLHRKQDDVTRETYAKVDALYRRLCMTPAPRVTPGDRMAASKAHRAAERNGWLPPLAWENIDDPDENPRLQEHRAPADSIDHAVVARLLDLETVRSTRAEKEEAMRRWLARGGSARQFEIAHNWKHSRYTPKGGAA